LKQNVPALVNHTVSGYSVLLSSWDRPIGSSPPDSSRLQSRSVQRESRATRFLTASRHRLVIHQSRLSANRNPPGYA